MIIFALFVLAAIVAVTVIAGVWLGSLAYTLWRIDKREELNSRFHETGFHYGPYVPQFPWFRVRQKPKGKRAA